MLTSQWSRFDSLIAHIGVRVAVRPDVQEVRAAVQCRFASLDLSGRWTVGVSPNGEYQQVGWLEIADQGGGGRIVSGFDLNDDGVFSMGDIMDKTIYGVIIVTTDDVLHSLEVATAYTMFLNAIGCDFAAAFLNCFLRDRPPPDTIGPYTTVPDILKPGIAIESDSLDHLLHHNVGAAFVPNFDVAPINRYVFSSDSKISAAVLVSRTIERLILKRLALAKSLDKVERAFAAYPGPLSPPVPFRFDWWPTLSDEPNLFYAFGGVRIHGRFWIVVDSQSRRVVSCHISAKLEDLYNWLYPKSNFDEIFAVIQASYGKLGSSGHVFRTEVNILGDRDIDYTFP
jgi:hypothetical protein